MDRFAADLEQYLRAPCSTDGTDIHSRHVALRLVRKIRHGTKGELELKALLQDLSESLPHVSDTIGERIRTQANFFLRIPLPMRPSASKRPSSTHIDPPAKRSKRTLEDAQLLYNYFHPLSTSDLPSVSGMLADASSSSPAISVAKASMQDIWQAAKPLLGPHKLLAAKIADMESEFEATDILLSAVIDALDNIVQILGRLCAPVRDPSVKKATDQLSTCREMLSLQGSSEKAEDAVEVAKASVYTLVQEMQQDMKAFKAGYTAASKGEGELREDMRCEAMRRERAVVTDIYGKQVLSLVAAWCGSSQDSLNRNEVAIRLVQLLSHQQAIALPDPVGTGQIRSSDVPPIFLLASKHLFRIQNTLQAIAVLATLSTLLPTKSSSVEWARRVWTLLASEIDTPESASEHTKVANIADEVLLAMASKAEMDPSHRDKVRRQVESMLSFDDPVFKLLRTRLASTMLAGLTAEGRTSWAKGFELQPLPQEIDKVIGSLKEIIDWACTCWEIPHG